MPHGQDLRVSENQATSKTLRKQRPQEVLANQQPREALEERIHTEAFPRKTVSFYRYVKSQDPKSLRDDMYRLWSQMGCLGRVYIAEEGINAQMSIPEPHYPEFLEDLRQRYPAIPVKEALAETAPSFFKLIIKVRKKIVADGLDDASFDPSQVGKHLNAQEFHEAMDDPDSILVDVRNYYESEIGHFEGAICPDVDTFREELPVIKDTLKGKEDKKILLYCTGGIRCEKTSAWLKHEGFQDVNQLHGGIIDYARQIKEQGLKSRFKGKNFVFDGRMGEAISDEVIARCHQCGAPADTHTNCAWEACHLLFIQCSSCAEKMDGCCSPECQAKTHLPEDEQVRLRKEESDPEKGFMRSRRRVDESVRCEPISRV